MDSGFNIWLKERTGYTDEELITLSFGKDGIIYAEMLESFLSQYQEEKLTKKLSFDEWLKRRTGHTDDELLHLALATGTAADYKRMMAFYRERYAREKQKNL